MHLFLLLFVNVLNVESLPSNSMHFRFYCRRPNCLRTSCQASKGSSNFLTSVVNNLKPFAAFYAIMLAPVYGIGIPGLGSMTDFTTLKNRGAPGTIANEYIVAPRDFTPARIDQVAPVYDVPAEVLKNEINKVVLSQPRVQFIAEDPPTRRIEYVQRTLIFRFPDVITFQLIPVDGGKSTFAVHSYSVYGAGDLGVNRNRVRSWINDLTTDLASQKGN